MILLKTGIPNIKLAYGYDRGKAKVTAILTISDVENDLIDNLLLLQDALDKATSKLLEKAFAEEVEKEKRENGNIRFIDDYR